MARKVFIINLYQRRPDEHAKYRGIAATNVMGWVGQIVIQR